MEIRDHRFGYALWGCQLALEFPTVKLRSISPTTLEATLNPLATLTLAQRDAQDTRQNPEERLRRKVARYRALLRQGYQAEDVRRLVRLLDQVLRLPAELETTAYHALRQVEEEVFGMKRFLASFEEQAWDEGHEAGKLEGSRTIIMHLLDRKLGTLPPEVQIKIAALTPDELAALGESMFDLASLDDLHAWLANY